MKAFETWKTAGVKYIALPILGGVSVMDETGLGYGSWMSVKSFLSRTEGQKEAIGIYKLTCSFVENKPFTPAVKEEKVDFRRNRINTLINRLDAVERRGK
jgi:hypothetical protein